MKKIPYSAPCASWQPSCSLPAERIGRSPNVITTKVITYRTQRVISLCPNRKRKKTSRGKTNPASYTILLRQMKAI